MPLSPGSSHSHLSPKAKSLSTSPNFNPFSPLSPFNVNKELEDDDSEVYDAEPDLGRISRHGTRLVYSRNVLLKVGRDRPLSSWPKPSGMAQLHEWYGVVNPKSPMDDPAIVSIGQGNGRKPGYDEGFGLGGGIGGKVLGRSGRHPAGTGHNDNTRARRHDLNSNGLPIQNKDTFSGPMGKFSMKGPGERLKSGGTDEARVAREDWRRAGGPPQPSRQGQDRRQWVNHQEEPSQPAWMDDETEIDPAIVVERDSTPFAFGAGNDPIAAHKRMMKGTGGSRKSETLVPFFANEETTPAGKPFKAPKQVNAADYLLPGKASAKPSLVTTQAEPLPVSSHSRFQRFFGVPQAGPSAAAPTNDRQTPDSAYSTKAPNPPFSPSHPSLSPSGGQTASMQSPPPTIRNQIAAHPPQDHTSRLMGMLMSPPPSGSTSNFQQSQPQQEQQHQHQPYVHTASPPPGMPYTRSSYTSPPPLPGGMMHLLDHRSPEFSQNYGPPPPSFPSNFTGHYPGPSTNYNPPPGLLPASTQSPPFSHPHHHGPPPPHAMTPNMHRPGYAYGPHPGAIPPPGSHVPPPQLGNPQHNLLATLYGNMHQGH